MKKRVWIFALAAVLCVWLAVPALAATSLVRDEYGVYDGETLAQLEHCAQTSAQQYGLSLIHI